MSNLLGKIHEIDQCFIPKDPNISADEFFRLAERQLLLRRSKSDSEKENIEANGKPDAQTVETKIIEVKESKQREKMSSVIGWGTFFNEDGSLEKRQFVS